MATSTTFEESLVCYGPAHLENVLVVTIIVIQELFYNNNIALHPRGHLGSYEPQKNRFTRHNCAIRKDPLLSSAPRCEQVISGTAL
jgi:hypothetical protein